jgi:protein-tyrosine sulfotransferase
MSNHSKKVFPFDNSRFSRVMQVLSVRRFWENPIRDLLKYLDYVFDRKSFIADFSEFEIHNHVPRSALAIRDYNYGPAVIIHGIMPRSGTVYVGELLRLHPDLQAYPRDLFEAPMLQVSDAINRVQRRFLRAYRHNSDKISDDEFLALFATAFIAHLYSEVPEESRILLKVPGVHYLHRFFKAFPLENLLVVIRDGRDVVESTRRTWPQLGFPSICRRWRRSADMVLACDKHFAKKESGYWLARFEDAVNDPVAFVREVCIRFNLDESTYPFGKISDIPVRGSSSLGVQKSVTWNPIEKPTTFTPERRWVNWSRRKKRIFKRIAGRALIDLGYCSNLDW